MVVPYSGRHYMQHRAYSLLTIKSIDEDQRVITGIATSPEADRMGDIVEPKGAEFKLPIPFLWQHASREPIGEVFAARVTSAGIEIKARVIKIAEPGPLQDRIDEAWQSIKYKLVRGLSIGFSPIESARIEGTYSFRFMKWLWLELSAVTIPANADATIQTIKSCDVVRPAAPTRDASPRPGAAGASRNRTMKNISEQLVAKRAELKTKTARLEELHGLESPTDAEVEERDTIADEVRGLSSDVERLRTLEGAQASLAVGITQRQVGGMEVPQQRSHVSVEAPKLPPGIGFARAVICRMAAHLSQGAASAMDIAKARYRDDLQVQALIKSAVEPGMTGAGGSPASTWAPDLVYPTNLVAEFIEFLRPMTIVGKFGTGSIPSLRRIPFNVRMVGQTSGGRGQWVGEAQPKPVKRFSFAPTSLAWAKVAAISVISDELARFSSPSAEMLVRDALAGDLAEGLDIDFIDPDKAEDASVSPASITNGVTPITSAGSDADAVRADIKALFSAFIAANINPTSGVFIMPNTVALALSLMRNPLGQPEFPLITMNGGTLEGLPVITSQYASFASPLKDIVVLAVAQEIFLSDDGQVSVDVSREASIEMESEPGGSPAGQTVSMFQNNLLALRAERYINWKKRRESAVAWIDNVTWGQTSGS